MTFESLRAYLELGYFLSQIALAVTAVIAAFFAAKQLSSFKTFELLKYIESKESREARFVVMREIKPNAYSDWWLSDKDGHLVKAASDVASSYDVLYLMLKKTDGATRRIFYENWADSVIRTHDVLEGYLNYRRNDLNAPSAYKGFSDLAGAVAAYADSSARSSAISLPPN